MSFLSVLFGFKKQQRDASKDQPPPEPAECAIRMLTGSPELAHETVQEHSDLFRKVKAPDFPVHIALHPDGFTAVQFPEGLPPYHFVNLLAVLNAPKADEQTGAAGWITSPGTGIRYSLQPEFDNEWGDTLVGSSWEGAPVRVYLPERAMCSLSTLVPPLPEPDFSAVPADGGIATSVRCDVDPSFELTHAEDTRWDV
jgi:hypothetical protein